MFKGLTQLMYKKRRKDNSGATDALKLTQEILDSSWSPLDIITTGILSGKY